MVQIVGLDTLDFDGEDQSLGKQRLGGQGLKMGVDQKVLYMG